MSGPSPSDLNHQIEVWGPMVRLLLEDRHILSSSRQLRCGGGRVWSDESWFIASVKGSAGGAVKWFAPFTCRESIFS